MDIMKAMTNFRAEATRILERHQAMPDLSCKRKVSTCTVFNVQDDGLSEIAWTMNGPANGRVCSGARGDCGCIHAEQKMASMMFRNPSWFDMHELVLMTPWSPCTHCANLIVTFDVFSGIFYDQPTMHDTRGVEILKNSLVVMALDVNIVSERGAKEAPSL